MDSGAENYRRFIAGDESGFEEIVIQYGPRLIFFINHYINNLDISEELMEDTFCELVVHKKRYRGEAKFGTYLFAIARNKAVDYIRKTSKAQTMIQESIPVKDEGLEEKILKDERNRQLYEAMDCINKDYRQVLHLIYFENMDYNEISTIMKKNKKQIKNLVYRAKEALKKALEKKGFVHDYIQDGGNIEP